MSKRGRPRVLNSPEDFLNLWNEYVEEVKSNPDVFIKELPKGQIKEVVPKPLTRQGFLAFAFRKLGHNVNHYIDNTGLKYNEFCEVVTYVRNCWENDQITGTLTGKYKAQTLVARLNGYSDRTEYHRLNEAPVNLNAIDFFKEGNETPKGAALGIPPITFFDTEEEKEELIN